MFITISYEFRTISYHLYRFCGRYAKDKVHRLREPCPKILTNNGKQLRKYITDKDSKAAIPRHIKLYTTGL